MAFCLFFWGDRLLISHGAQTAGLTLAARLTEDESVTVAVLEAGKANLGDPLVRTGFMSKIWLLIDGQIDVPGQFARVLGNPQV